MAALATFLPVFFMLGLGFASRILGWVEFEQKEGANALVFGVLFPILIFNLISSAQIDLGVLPIVGLIIFCLGYDLTIDRRTLAPILRLGAVCLVWSAITILGFFVLFHNCMANRKFLMAVLIYFSCPTGFGMAPLLHPLYRRDQDVSFTSAFMSLYIVVTLIAYTLVVLLVA